MRKKAKEEFCYGVIEGQQGQTVNLEASQVLKDYMDILRYQSKQRNNLLGQFDLDGKYKIEDEKILTELLSLPKKFDEKVDNIVYASTKIGNFVLNFKIVFDIAESYCNANISLIEIEQGIEEDIKHITLLDTLVEPYSPQFKENAYKLWNIHFDADTVVKNDYLYSLLHMQEEEFLFNKELTEILSQLYIVRMLKLLDSTGQLGEKIIFQYKLLVEKLLANDPSITQNNTKLKMVLDSVILKNNAYKDLLKSKDGVLILANYSAPIKRVMDKTTPGIIRQGNEKPKDRAEKKKEEKKAASKKSDKKKSKSKSGSSIKPFIYDFSKAFGNTYTGFSTPKVEEVPIQTVPPQRKNEPETDFSASGTEAQNGSLSHDGTLTEEERKAIEQFESAQEQIDENLGDSMTDNTDIPEPIKEDAPSMEGIENRDVLPAFENNNDLNVFGASSDKNKSEEREKEL